jgi:hypothetical protein
MNLQELATLVRDMRTEQKNYFRYRTPDHLQNSKKLEKLVDAAVAEILPEAGSQKPEANNHPKLF